MVLPFIKPPYPWYDTNKKMLNMKAFQYPKKIDIHHYPIKFESETFNSKWRMKSDWTYAKRVVEKYLFFEKGVKINEFEKFNIENIGEFTLGYLSNHLTVFIGDSNTYLKVHCQLVQYHILFLIQEVCMYLKVCCNLS